MAHEGNLKETVIQRSFQDESLMGVDVNLSVVLGRTTLRIYQLLKLGRGAVIELDHKADDAVEVLANDIPIAKGDVLVPPDDSKNKKVSVILTELLLSHSDNSEKATFMNMKKRAQTEKDAEVQGDSDKQEDLAEDMRDNFDDV